MALSPKNPKYGSIPGAPVYGSVGSGAPAVSMNNPVGAPEVKPFDWEGSPGQALAQQGAQPATPALTGTFGAASGNIDQAKLGLLDAMARGGQQGVAAYQQAQQNVGTQQGHALQLALGGNAPPLPAGMEGILRSQVEGPSQQRNQALTQAQANFTGDLDRQRAASNTYLDAAKAVLPIQQQQFGQQRDLVSQQWDRAMQLELLKQQDALARAAASGGGGGGGGGGSSSKPLAVGAVTDLLTSIGGGLRTQEGQQYLDAADHLLQAPNSAINPDQYTRDEQALGLLEDQQLAAQGAQIQGRQQAAVQAAEPSIDDALLGAQAQQQGTMPALHGLSGLARLPSVLANALPMSRSQDLSQIDQERTAAQQAPSPYEAYQPSPEWQQQYDTISQQRNNISQTLAGLAGPRYGAYGEVGGQALDTLNQPLSRYAPDAAALATAAGYNLGAYADPNLAQGMFPLPTPADEAKTSNDRLAEQRQALELATQTGAQDAYAQHYGTSDPAAIGFLKTLDSFNPSASEDRSATNAQAAADRTAASQQVDQVVNTEVGTTVALARSGQITSENVDQNLGILYDRLVGQGVPEQQALQIVSQVSNQITDLLAE